VILAVLVATLIVSAIVVAWTRTIMNNRRRGAGYRVYDWGGTAMMRYRSAEQMNPKRDNTDLAVIDEEDAIANDLLEYLLEQPPALRLTLLQFHISMMRARREACTAGTLFH
jgi:hypothetical protein